MSHARPPDIRPGDVIEANEDDHDGGDGPLRLLVIAVGWRERGPDDDIWLNLRGVRIGQPGAQPQQRCLQVRLTALRIRPRDRPLS